MPRIRPFKPEHRQHRKVGALDDRTYRLWASMILEADDDGRLVANPEQLRVLTFAFHPQVLSEDVEKCIQTLATAKLIRLYISKNVRYAYFPSWRDHQRLDKHNYWPSKLPPPPGRRPANVDIHKSGASLPPDGQQTERRIEKRREERKRGERGEKPLAHATEDSNGHDPRTGHTTPINPALNAVIERIKAKHTELGTQP